MSGRTMISPVSAAEAEARHADHRHLALLRPHA
jgi:hypothetical protein